MRKNILTVTVATVGVLALAVPAKADTAVLRGASGRGSATPASMSLSKRLLPGVTSPCRSRMSFSSLKAGTTRAKCAASAIVRGPVSPNPASGTPHLLDKTNSNNVIRQLVECGHTIYAVGRFSEIIWNGAAYSRHNIFSFQATAPYTVTSWKPDANDEVNSIALSPNCSDAYIGGAFTSVHGTAADHLAKVSTSTGTVILSWAHDANNLVNTLVLTPNGHLIAGGRFTSINGSTTHPYLASLNPSTGAVQPYLALRISGHYHYCSRAGVCSAKVSTTIYNQQLSHSGTLLLEEGDFTSVGGQARQQIFMLNLATDPVTVTGWTSPEWDGSQGNLPHGYPYQCWYGEPFYIRSAAWSPNDSVIYLATTGERPWNWRYFSRRIGLCDATSAFPARQTPVKHLWVNYTGCDSLYVAAADPYAVYVGGHPRWIDNAHGCNYAGRGAIPYPGMQVMHPGNGAPLLTASGKAQYSMARANADDMVITPAGLWIASSNRFGSNACNQVSSHAGICFLPYK